MVSSPPDIEEAGAMSHQIEFRPDIGWWKKGPRVIFKPFFCSRSIERVSVHHLRTDVRQADATQPTSGDIHMYLR
jgi:hypothetical protein